MTKFTRPFQFLVLVISVSLLVSADQPAKGKQGPKAGGSQAQSKALFPLVGASEASVRLNTWFDQPAEFFFTWGPGGQPLDRSTETSRAFGQGTVETVLKDLEPGQTWGYQLHWKHNGETDFREGPVGRFVTPRAPGEAFRFVIEADPHLDENASPSGYLTALHDMAALTPDFCVDLGDASMVGKLAGTLAEARDRNLVVRSYWDELGGTAPFFMVLGNHDGEVGWADGKSPMTTAQARDIRRSLFPNPDPTRSRFYQGISDTSYAFTWGDALVVALDPFNPTTRRTAQGTAWTLGQAQLDWLASTLRTSRVAFKFVFIHHLVGGPSSEARGGAQAASQGEWGAQIHPLLVETKVNAVFHGHDHFYSREVKDGVVYQLVPQPSALGRPDVAKTAAKYGYTGGDNLPSPGFLLVTVGPQQATVELRISGSTAVTRSYSFRP